MGFYLCRSTNESWDIMKTFRKKVVFYILYSYPFLPDVKVSMRMKFLAIKEIDATFSGNYHDFGGSILIEKP